MIKAVKRKISGIPIPKIPNAAEEIEVNARFFILDDFDMFFCLRIFLRVILESIESCFSLILSALYVFWIIPTPLSKIKVKAF